MDEKELLKLAEINKVTGGPPVKVPRREPEPEPEFKWADPGNLNASKPDKEPEPPEETIEESEEIEAIESEEIEETETEEAGEVEAEEIEEAEEAGEAETSAEEPDEKEESPDESEEKVPEKSKVKKEKAPKVKKQKTPKIKKEKPLKIKKQRPPRRKRDLTDKQRRAVHALQAVVGVMLALVLVASAYVAYVALTLKDIDTENIYSNIDMSSFLYDKDGHEIDKIYYSEDREVISINEIPENTRNAFIAIEDKTFYEHHGFNFRRMIGAVINKVLGRSEEISGTSTITQQLARNVFLADVKSQRTIKRKVSEMLYARQLERTLTKDEILEAYLNTIYLGYGNYGIEAAARSYFDKDVRKLTLAESAALAALPQAPDSYALLRDEKGEDTTYLRKYDVYANDASKERRDLVLKLMTEQGYISAGEAASAKVKIKDILKPHRDKKSGEYTYFTDYVVNTVAGDLEREYKLSPEEAQRLVYTGGLQIYTTADPEIQQVVNEEFDNDYNFPWSAEEPQAAMVITDVSTGQILAMSGGRGATGRRLFNRAISPRQPGSSIKPLTVYSAALQKSFDYAAKGQTFPFVDYGFDRQGVNYWGDYITASSSVTDEQMNVNGEIWPQNFSRRFTGRQTFRTALQQSINTCAVKIQLQTGADYSMDMLRKYGISTAVDDESKPVNDLNSAALGLGAMTYGVTPLDMAEAYAAFPNGGVRHEASCYTEVLDAEGRVLLTSRPNSVKVMDEGVAFIMTDCLKSVVSRGIARSASLYGVQAGGKTGTTNDTADIWFCGFTPDYSAALWIGTDHNSEMNTTSSTAAALWSRIMRQIPDIAEGEYKEMPDDVIYQGGEYYTRGTEPSYTYYTRRR